MLTPRQMESSVPIAFQTQEMQESLKTTGVYQKDSFIVQQLNDFDQYREDEYVPAEEDYVFALQNKDPKAPFLGVVDYFFKRDGYCLNTFLNGDVYFGNYNNDLRNKQGLYSFKPIKKENFLLSQFYYGLWKNDFFHGKGIYLWLQEEENKKPFTDYDNAKFEAFVGNSNEGIFQKGALLSKEGNNFFVYYGLFSENGKKEGNKCFYYSSKLEKICYGNFNDGIFVEGYVGNYNKEGKLIDLIIYKKEEGKNAEGEKINIEKEENIKNILTRIREVIFLKNYFKIIYEEFGNIIKFRDENMNDIKVIATEEYAKIIKCFKLNKISLCEDIEKYVGL